MKPRIISLLGLLALGGCATSYDHPGAMGDITAERLDDRTVRIKVLANGFTDPATVESYVLRRAADETIKDGFDGFTIVSNNPASKDYQPGLATASGVSITYEPLLVGQLPVGNATIEMLHKSDPSWDQARTFAAAGLARKAP